MKSSNFLFIQPRSKVTFLIPNGIGRDGLEWKQKTGQVVMRGSVGWVVNGGGKHGTPYVVTEDNFVSVTLKNLPNS